MVRLSTFTHQFGASEGWFIENVWCENDTIFGAETRF